MNLVAVTACPTGVAHTYMAKVALEKEAKKLGHTIKVETQGAIGIENGLTQKEIEEADGIILAIEMNILKAERFKGKKVLKISVSKALKNPEDAIEKALA
ncbi:fructose PTS transporter subunit IIB [Clostridium sp. D2Q-11]|uniref:Fructose PTS transporter subunit IIB n=1 Tax=Anaeromonas frigoriresistens TaxID=2683708 RepID=A0A942UWT3_9FIRM|nr:PTS fructose transporter subunit IIB [Anaeromonas frigoriresistens]MBS4538346.1 fructose PTS transporter subunit IIB [Anaeromonas frigoriresistens]